MEMTKNKRRPCNHVDFRNECFPPLEAISRPTIPTRDAAYYLNREPRTLRGWASLENGPIRPIRIFGKLGWPVAEIRALLDGTHA